MQSLIRTSLILYAAALLFTSHAAHATMHKCKGADGRTSYQDDPCPLDAKSSTVKAPPPGPVAPPIAPESKASSARKADKGIPTVETIRARREQEAREQEAASARAYNKSTRCNNARRQLDIAKGNRPIYSLDNKGERNFVSDDQRAGVVKDAEMRVAAECN
jgi:hypothetical protein